MSGAAAAPPRAQRVLGPALEHHYQYLLWLIPTLEKLPRAQKFMLGDRMQSTALQVLDELIAATYTRNRRPALLNANLGLEKLRLLTRLTYDLRLLDVRRYEFAVRSLDETGRLVGGWMRADAAATRTPNDTPIDTPASQAATRPPAAQAAPDPAGV